MKVMNDEFYMDGYLKDNLDMIKKVIKKDWDMIFSIDGAEGSGKSVLAMQIAYYCDPTLNLDRIVFNPEEFQKAIIKAKPYEAVIYDEAYTGLSSRATMSAINKTLIGMLAEIRQKNLFVFVVMPTFFDLDKYVALWRSRVLIHVYTGKNFERGFFRFYNASRKKNLYVNGKKFYNYNVTKPNFIGRFTKFYPISQDEYRKKKLEALTLREKKESVSMNELKANEYLGSLLWFMNKKKGYTCKQLGEFLSNNTSYEMGERGISHRITNYLRNKTESGSLQ